MIISNPIASPLFGPVVSLVASVLGGTLTLLLAISRFNLQQLKGSVLFKRWCVWTVVALLYGSAVLVGPVGAMVLAGLLTLQALREYSHLVGLPRSYTIVLVAAGLVVVPIALVSRDAFYLLPALLLMVGTLQPLFFGKTEQGIRHLALAVLGWGYIAWLLGHMVLLSKYSASGHVLLLAIGLGTALSDVGAFTIGKLLGKHKLAPRISPNKTWEGVMGNLLGASVGVGLLSVVLGGALGLPRIALLSVLIAAGSLWGDLFESAVKREFGAKDAGAWLPGFGGLLDRIDSLIFVVPLVYYATILTNWLAF
jgi:phosphatidate cytidylyltransferase